MVKIREEKPEDMAAVRRVNDQAFGGPLEGRIVDDLRGACQETLRLVAVWHGAVVGHIFFSQVTVDTGDQTVAAMGLAPMAVLPEFQNRGIGSQLVREGIRRLGKAGCPFIVVLGHAGFYPRFGFKNAAAFGLASPWEETPEAAFMVRVLDPPAMDRVSGIVRYAVVFDTAASDPADR